VALEHHKRAVSYEEQANHYQQGVLCGRHVMRKGHIKVIVNEQQLYSFHV